jgi:hypothetical protein
MENMKQMTQELLRGMEERINANRKADRDELKAIMNAFQEKLDSIQEKVEARMANFEEKMDDYRNKRMAMLDAHHKSIMVSLGQTETNTEKTVPDPEMMQSAEEHRDVPSEDVIVRPVKGLRKRRRGRKLTARQRGEPKELTQGDCGS